MISPESDCHYLHLSETKHKAWLNAIVLNKPEQVQRILDTTSSEKQSLLLGHFTYDDGHVSRHLKGQCFRLRLPLALALAAGYREIAKILIKEGADIYQKDCKGNNVIHSLITQIFYLPTIEHKIVTNFQYLLQLLTADQVSRLLHAENQWGLRPLEFAAQNGACEMVMAIMNVPDVYLYREELHGFTRYRWYDVTDYEDSTSRYNLSPVVLLTFLDKKVITTAGFAKMHNSFLAKWMEMKFLINIPFIVMLFLERLLIFVCFLLLDMDTSFYEDYIPGNTTNHCRPPFAPVWSSSTVMALSIVLILLSLGVILCDILEISMHYTKKHWASRNTIEGTKEPLVQVAFYRYCNLLFACIMFVFVTLMSLGVDLALYYNVARIVCPILAVWNILYFIQLLPSIGYFIITIQTILTDLLNFIIVYLFFMIPFFHSFQTIINTNTNVGCMDSFSSIFRVAYSLFLTMLNMIDYTTYNIRSKEVLLSAHVLYTFVVSIMMINFFIALLSNSVQRMFLARATAMRNQRSTVALLVERRFMWVFRKLYTIIKRRFFIYEKDRVLLLDISSMLLDDDKSIDLCN